MASLRRGSLFALLSSVAACSERLPPSDAGADAGADVAVVDTPAADVSVTPDVAPVGSLAEGDCDPLDESQCALPWPSNHYLRRDPSRRTGYTLTFGATSLPANGSGEHIDPLPYRRLDGYGVSTPIMARFPGLAVDALATEEHPERSMAPDASVLLFEVSGTSLQRVPHFVELDGTERDPQRQILYVRPLVLLKEGTRYVVAFRNLRSRAGQRYTPSPAFVRLRDGTTTGDRSLSWRQERFTDTLSLLDRAGIQRSTLDLAWDFNTGSNDGMHGHLLAMRDDALRRFPMGPELRIDDTRTFLPMRDGSGRPYDDNIAIELSGTIEVPHYMRPRRAGTVMAWELALDAQGRPVAMGTRSVRFWVRVPHSALGGTPHGLVHYGHGLLGSGEEIRAGQNGRLANNHNLVFFSASLAGMSEEDVAVVLQTVRDGSNFVSISDRLQQGLVEWVLLARAMRERLPALTELTSRNVRINRSELFYSGISQGGIFGGSYLALSPDVTRGHLGVPGNNYSTLLHRSQDFVGYFQTVRGAYPDTADQSVFLGAVQLLWDATDPVTHLRHLSAEPYANTPAHHAIFAPAKGDYEVAVFTNEITARSNIGVALMANYDRTRTPWGITPTAYPHRGSGVVLYDFGNPWPSPGNHPPMDSVGNPHGRPRQQAWHDRQMVTFFRTGEIVDVCGGDGCHPD